jgi:hypothetical protein
VAGATAVVETLLGKSNRWSKLPYGARGVVTSTVFALEKLGARSNTCCYCHVAVTHLDGVAGGWHSHSVADI